MNLSVRAGSDGLGSVRDRARAMCADPASFFDQSYTAMQSIARDELELLQLEGLNYRLGDLRGRIGVLQKLADNQGISKLESLDDAVPLLFEHTMYKSYPPALLENARFAEINRFLSRLCAFDLTTIDVSACETIDDWLQTMDRQSPLLIMHSSGSSGTMSFLPMSKREWDKFGALMRVTSMQSFGEDPTHVYDEEIYTIYPYFRHGGSSHIRMCELYVKYLSGSEDRVLTAYPGRMSSDLLYLGARMQAAQAKGELSRLKVSPAMLARKDEYEKLRAQMPEHLTKFFLDITERLQGKRIFFWGMQNLLYNVTRIGVEKGLQNVFSPNSVIGTGGDLKEGLRPPADWREQAKRFIGVDRIHKCYGMTETGGYHHLCEHGHYHFAPWIVPFVLDPDTGTAQPRRGRATGRAAFFDLGSETRWGGFITGDEITVDWETRCPCGQSSAWAEDNIQRYSLKRGGDDKINCAATEGAHKEAMNFLTSL
jgi:hypothetical protein